MFPIYISQSLPQSQATSINIDAKKIKKTLGRVAQRKSRPARPIGLFCCGPPGPEEIFLELARASLGRAGSGRVGPLGWAARFEACLPVSGKWLPLTMYQVSGTSYHLLVQ
jgi:hypothetical protein